MKNNLTDAILSCEMKYDIYQNSFSPIYSNFGLGLDGNFAGIRTLYMHYNRTTHTLFEPVFELSGKIKSYIPRADKVTYETDFDKCEIAFYDTDCVAVKCVTEKEIQVFSALGKTVSDMWICEKNDNQLILQGYSKNLDDRDPDKETAVMAGVSAVKGKIEITGDDIYVTPENGEIYLAFAFDVLNVDSKKIRSKLDNIPCDIEEAAKNTRQWINETVKDLNISLSDDKSSTVFIKALATLIFNLTKASGNLGGYISAFPNRGGYATHFMWDTCFQNLAYELMNINIAKDALLQLCANIRCDGKIPMFLCSTWVRPFEAQPALLGWAAKRIYEIDKDIEFIKKILEPMEENNRWWLTQRITRFGVIKCPHGLETGQDNSPRFDEGAVLAVDMNSYLLNQLKVTGEFAEILGLTDKALYWKNKAQELNDNMIKYLYNEEKNMFFDAYADSGKMQTLLTTSGIIPLWAGITLPEDKSKAMIKDYLLNPEYFYGAVPFPSIAYTESVYDPADWWRGPTWVPEAWLMFEVLKNYGFIDEYKENCEKLYNILLKDGVLHEHFNSKTGEGMGFIEQGWTAAIFIKLYMNIQSRGEKNEK